MNTGEPLTHNPKNAVTKRIERQDRNGQPVVCKVLSGVNTLATPQEWRASDDARHWNYWLREWCVYDSELAEQLAGSGVRLPKSVALNRGELEATLVMEFLPGRTGFDLSWDDFALIARRWGQAQAMLRATNLLEEPWTSRRFLRTYTQSKPVDYRLVDPSTQQYKAVWSLELVQACWPPELRDGLVYLYAHREALYDMMENAPQIPCHLDFWPNNVFVQDGDVIPVDWAFLGSGAYGEDVGNFIPDAVFDGFVAGEDILALESLMVDAYTTGVIEVAAPDIAIEKTLWASAVKYVWLGPLLLERASSHNFSAYGGEQISEQAAHEQYRNRGLALMRMCEWAELALT